MPQISPVKVPARRSFSYRRLFEICGPDLFAVGGDPVLRVMRAPLPRQPLDHTTNGSDGDYPNAGSCATRNSRARYNLFPATVRSRSNGPDLVRRPSAQISAIWHAVSVPRHPLDPSIDFLWGI